MEVGWENRHGRASSGSLPRLKLILPICPPAKLRGQQPLVKFTAAQDEAVYPKPVEVASKAQKQAVMERCTHVHHNDKKTHLMHTQADP